MPSETQVPSIQSAELDQMYNIQIETYNFLDGGNVNDILQQNLEKKSLSVQIYCSPNCLRVCS